MMIHSMVPVKATPKALAIEGKLMFTIDASSVVMNVPTVTTARTAQRFATAGPSTAGIGLRCRYSPTANEVKAVFGDRPAT